MDEEKHICNNTCGVTSSHYNRQKLLVSLFLEREKLKEKNKTQTTPERPEITEITEYCCYKNMTEHLQSESCITVDPNDSNLENFISTACCLPFKIVLCLPLHIGAGINSILNCLCKTDKNYLL
jgi:hypothetical protein